jgi:hypothetical protein
MDTRAAVLLLLLAGTSCESDRGRDRGRSPDCDVVLRDPGNAAARLSQQYRGEPVKVAEIIERCVAPSGPPCERLAKIVAALPGLMPAGSPTVTAPGNVAEACAGMSPEMQRCMLPSYALGHSDECAKIRAAFTAGPSASGSASPSSP